MTALSKLPEMPRVLVCGGRTYSNREYVFRVLDHVHSVEPIFQVIHGAAKGADSLAGEWAKSRNVLVSEHPADWDAHGKKAGFKRNEEMIKLGPDLVVAFAGGNGTMHTVSLAENAKIPVIQP